MTATVIAFPTHRVRRADPLTKFCLDQAAIALDQTALAAASLGVSLNVLRAIYGLPPLEVSR